MKNNEYESVEQMDSDLTLMLENSKRYNVPHSSIYKRALKLQHIQQVRAKSRDVCFHLIRQCFCLCDRGSHFNVVVCSDEEEGASAERRRRRRQHAVLSHV